MFLAESEEIYLKNEQVKSELLGDDYHYKFMNTCTQQEGEEHG
jgi:hypothetical protein